MKKFSADKFFMDNALMAFWYCCVVGVWDLVFNCHDTVGSFFGGLVVCFVLNTTIGFAFKRYYFEEV